MASKRGKLGVSIYYSKQKNKSIIEDAIKKHGYDVVIKQVRFLIFCWHRVGEEHRAKELYQWTKALPKYNQEILLNSGGVRNELVEFC